MSKKTVSIGDLFTDEELMLAQSIFLAHQGTNMELHNKLVEQIVRGALPRINQVTEQENSEGYMAYVLEYSWNEACNSTVAPPSSALH